MLFPELAVFTDPALLLLRIMIALVFGVSGWGHVRDPKGRAESIGMSSAFTLALGWVELVGAIALVIGLAVQVAAALLAGVMLGAIYKKMFVWKTGLWGGGAGEGWYYEVLYLVCNLVLIATAGGGWTLMALL